jgi:hypothetical protein
MLSKNEAVEAREERREAQEKQLHVVIVVLRSRDDWRRQGPAQRMAGGFVGED